MRIESATLDDVDPVTDLWVELAEDQRQHGSHLLARANRESVRMDVARHVVDEGLVIARDDAGLVGFIMFDIEAGTRDRSVRRGVVQNVYVVPEARDRGVGSALFDVAEARLAAGGADVVALEVMAQNEAARRFYRQRGYEPHRVVYERDLDDATPG